MFLRQNLKLARKLVYYCHRYSLSRTKGRSKEYITYLAIFYYGYLATKQRLLEVRKVGKLLRIWFALKRINNPRAKCLLALELDFNSSK